MPRILFTSTGGSGHFNPMAPFVAAFVRAGHEVVVAAPASQQAAAQRTGATFHLLDDPSPDEVGRVMAGLAGLSDEQANEVVCREIFGRLDVEAAYPGLDRLLADWSVDLLLRESGEMAGALAAEQHAVPQARVAIGLAAVDTVIAGYVEPSLAVIRERLSLSPDPGGRRLLATPQVTLFPASLESAGDQAGGSGTRHAHDWPVLRFRDPAWTDGRRRPGEGRPFVYLTFGSVAGGLPHLTGAYAAARDAVAGLDADVLFTTGHGLSPETLGPLPQNLRVEPWVDQAEVLARARAVVCHGGGGSTLGALAAGVPLVVVPLFALDQFYNADQVVAVGAGLRSAPDAGSIRAALDAVLADPDYAACAGAVADELAGHDHPDRAPDLLLTGYAAG